MASDRTSIDPGLLELFQSEMDAHIPVLSQGLLALEKGLVDGKQIEAMMRAAHSIKGAARIVGIDPAVRVAHALEDCFTAAKEKRITLGSDSVDILLRGVDALQRACSSGDAQELTEDEIQSLLSSISQVKTGSAGGSSTAAAVPAAAPATVAPETAKVAAAVAAGTTVAPLAEAPSAVPSELVAAKVSADEPSLTFPAEFSTQAAEGLRRQFLDTLALRPARIQIDFRHVSHTSASLLALLSAFADHLNQLRGRTSAKPPVVVATGASPSLLKVVRMAGLSGVFTTGGASDGSH